MFVLCVVDLCYWYLLGLRYWLFSWVFGVGACLGGFWFVMLVFFFCLMVLCDCCIGWCLLLLSVIIVL